MEQKKSFKLEKWNVGLHDYCKNCKDCCFCCFCAFWCCCIFKFAYWGAIEGIKNIKEFGSANQKEEITERNCSDSCCSFCWSNRTYIVKAFGIKENCCESCLISTLCMCCSNLQEINEIEIRRDNCSSVAQ